jgi:hypothetical protein
LARLLEERGTESLQARFLDALARHLEKVHTYVVMRLREPVAWLCTHPPYCAFFCLCLKFRCADHPELHATSRLFLVAFFQLQLRCESFDAIPTSQLLHLLRASLEPSSESLPSPIAASSSVDMDAEHDELRVDEDADGDDRAAAERAEWLLRFLLLRQCACTSMSFELR